MSYLDGALRRHLMSVYGWALSSPLPHKSKLWLLIIMWWQVYHLAGLVTKVVRLQLWGTHWWAAPPSQKQRNWAKHLTRLPFLVVYVKSPHSYTAISKIGNQLLLASKSSNTLPGRGTEKAFSENIAWYSVAILYESFNNMFSWN